MNNKISATIAAILSSASLAARAQEPPASAQAPTAEATEGAIQEVTVTAQRRAQNMQDVPISMQAFTARRCNS